MRRMKDEKGRIVEGEDGLSEVLARHWKNLGGVEDCSEDEGPDTEMGDVGGCEWVCVKKLSWEEVVEGLKCLRRGKAPSPDGILNEMVMYGGGRLVEVMLQVMNLCWE